MTYTAEPLPDTKAALTTAARSRDYGEVARILSASIVPDFGPDTGPSLLEIDPRPCLLCGLTIDRHEMVDDGEGPEFFCPDLLPDEMTLPELERRAELRCQEELAAILAAMVDCPPLVPRSEPHPYRPAQSTIDAFCLITAAGDVNHLRGWLTARPKDAPFLLALLESPTPCL